VPRALPDAVFRFALFVLPFAIAFLYVVSLLPILSPEAWSIVVFGGMALYMFSPLGAEIVIPAVVLALGENAPAHVVVLAVVSVVMVDVLTALFIAWNWDLLERVPRLGGVLRRVEGKCRAIIARRRWGEGATLAALAAYVALPVQMTGGLFSSVLGRVMGLDRTRVFAAVVAGSLAGAVPMAVLAVLIRDPLLDALESPTAQSLSLVAGILIMVAFIAAVVVLYLRGTRNASPG
jgi:hypothetical protein